MALLEVPRLDTVLDDLAAAGSLVHVERIAARAARFAELSAPLSNAVRARLPVDRLWSHQAAAIDLVRAGQSVAIATGTASGKSLCFHLPVAEIVSDPIRPGTALLVFPTKALARDQLRALTELEIPGLVAAAYDGDCSPEERTWVRKYANVVLTNPEMLHYAVLPHHARWATFLMRLRFVVLDELHAFRGVFGSHVAHVLRRLRRVSASYAASPTFIGCSATIGAPAELASALWAGPVRAVTDDASPRGERVIALCNPPLLDESWSRTRVSSHSTTASVLAALIDRGHKSIGFCRSRRGTEAVAADVRRRLDPDLAERVQPYRGGYLPEERRAIEQELFSGRVRGVVATTALELGVDIGGLDACVLDGFPGTIASMWQQMGRAGRACQSSLAVLVAGEDQLDQWLMAHPSEVFRRPPEPAVVNPANPFILHPQLGCAAFELPLTAADERWWPELLDDGVREMVLDDRLKVRPPTSRRPLPSAVWSARGFPAHGIGLRSGSTTEYRIARDDDSLVGTVDEARAFDLVHPGAVYLHQGATYRVSALDLDDHVARVEPCDGTEYTVARTDMSMRVLSVDHQRPVGHARLQLGAIEVASQVTGYQRKDALTGDVIGTSALDLPPTRLETRGVWYTIEPRALEESGLTPARWAGTLHAVEHAAIGILPLFTICDRWDVGGVSTVRQLDTGLPTILIYDGYPGGTGIAELGFRVADDHLPTTLDVISACSCTDGCPSCVQSPKCGNWNEPLDKAGAIALLRRLLDLDGREQRPFGLRRAAREEQQECGPHAQVECGGEGLQQSCPGASGETLDGTTTGDR
ncbi:MAG TPA: DEAD/DEAH box helicase [Acidimicrobiales bacterium]|jgi:DEAD/DEAH box helicase domain-containing protein|nr:DEAD/DEAH box helicase [Acidimicrobiales bacterium]